METDRIISEQGKAASTPNSRPAIIQLGGACRRRVSRNLKLAGKNAQTDPDLL